MKTWGATFTLAALAAVFALGGCDTNSPPDLALIEETLDQLQLMEEVSSSLVMDGETGAIYEHTEIRSLHRTTDRSEILRFARSQGLTRTEIEILLDRMDTPGDTASVRIKETLIAGPNPDRAKRVAKEWSR